MLQGSTNLCDDTEDGLHDQGWSVGDCGYRTPEGLIWMVFCQRGEERIVAKARGQAEAWRLAGGQVE